jgi:hypothetical protein
VAPSRTMNVLLLISYRRGSDGGNLSVSIILSWTSGQIRDIGLPIISFRVYPSATSATLHKSLMIPLLFIEMRNENGVLLLSRFPNEEILAHRLHLISTNDTYIRPLNKSFPHAQRYSSNGCVCSIYFLLIVITYLSYKTDLKVR